MTTRSALRDAMLANRAGIEARQAHVSAPSWSYRLARWGLIAALGAVFVYGLITLEVSWTRVLGGFGELGRIVGLMLPPDHGTTSKLLVYLKALAETLAIAFLGTLSAAVLVFPLSFLAARNVLPVWIARFVVRRSFDTIRGVETLIWALIWINVVGLGPFAGVLAILTSDFGTFGKLFSEAIETSDKRPVEGVMASGGGASHAIRFGIVPQIIPLIASQVLYYFESNTRSATIIGIVGAGGIGMHLAEQIRTLEWQHVSFLVLLVLITVGIIDWISGRLRLAVIGTAVR